MTSRGETLAKWVSLVMALFDYLLVSSPSFLCRTSVFAAHYHGSKQATTGRMMG